MKKFLLIGLLVYSAFILAIGQEQPQKPELFRINRNNLTLRPNSRDYTIVRKGNSHQRVIQMRTHTLMRQKQAMVNRKKSMERRRTTMQQKMIRQQQIKQRMIRQRGMHR